VVYCSLLAGVIVKMMTVLPLLKSKIKRAKRDFTAIARFSSRGLSAGFDDFQ